MGDPRRGDIDVIDWIESIPIYETRNYVQRVLEDVQVYRLRLGGAPTIGSLEADLAR
jgi:soluble lytic murein transglycosylase